MECCNWSRIQTVKAEKHVAIYQKHSQYYTLGLHLVLYNQKNSQYYTLGLHLVLYNQRFYCIRNTDTQQSPLFFARRLENSLIATLISQTLPLHSHVMKQFPCSSQKQPSRMCIPKALMYPTPTSITTLTYQSWWYSPQTEVWFRTCQNTYVSFQNQLMAYDRHEKWEKMYHIISIISSEMAFSAIIP